MNEEDLLYTSVHAPGNLEKGCIFCYIHQSQSSCLISGNTTVCTLGSRYILLEYDYHVTVQSVDLSNVIVFKYRYDFQSQ